ncbi:carboxylate--amine ligase [Dictyobacter arantiisoli]|uniref:ATP-grasp domain-containing protein n=1 Tax=Dictyobacter arantiisoli TaxID=2014874 RepID=A0A5A5T9Y4_9CHLR|nr:ATP-grasp domain-containing protein [Dictyobacter arantiisoli]GCF08208.1 hypothetical protein KDI_17720 [Dictyobacter arantiisoli]
MQDSLKSNTSDLEKSIEPVVASSEITDMARQEHPATYDALILDANLRQSLVTIRSLGRRGLHVAALETRDAKYVPTFASRWCAHSYRAPVYDRHTEAYTTYLQQLLTHTGAGVVFASSDGTLAVLREYRTAIERHTRLALAKESALEAATNKGQTLEVARRLGIGVPEGVVVSGIDEVSEAIHEIGLPAVIKPIETWLWGEQQGLRLLCELVTTPDEARRAVEKLTCSGGTTLFQQFLAGRREAVSLLYARGDIAARFAQWAKRTQPPLGGTSVLRQSIAMPEDIGSQAELLVREIDLEGYSEVEFRRDARGKPYLMEINPRLSASVEVAVRAGIDFPYLLYQWASGERLQPIKGYQIGRWMRYLGGDIVSTVEALEARGRPGVTSPVQTLLNFGTSFFIPTGYDYVDWQDLSPAWIASKDFLSRAKKQVGQRSFRRTKE